MPNKDSRFEDDELEDNELESSGHNDKEFKAERDRFAEWVFDNEKLQAHAASRAKKKKYPQGIIEDARQKMLEGVLRQYGKGKNKLQILWRNIEKQSSAAQHDPEEELTIYLKKTFNNKCIDVLKEIGFIQNEDGEWILREEPTDQPVGDGNVTPPNNAVEKSEMWQRIRVCIRNHYRSKHLATYLQIINFWEVGIREPQAICPSITGLTPSSYNDLQGALNEFLNNHRDCWVDEEEVQL
jgi:hypothetical protein